MRVCNWRTKKKIYASKKVSSWTLILGQIKVFVSLIKSRLISTTLGPRYMWITNSIYGVLDCCSHCDLKKSACASKWDVLELATLRYATSKRVWLHWSRHLTGWCVSRATSSFPHIILRAFNPTYTIPVTQEQAIDWLEFLGIIWFFQSLFELEPNSHL